MEIAISMADDDLGNNRALSPRMIEPVTENEKAREIPLEDSDHGDEEDPIERYEFEIEDSVARFIDEGPIRHNVYPDSESEAEDAINVQVRVHNHIARGDGMLYEGQVFYNGIAFKEAVLDYVLRTCRNIKQYRWDKTKLVYNCGMREEDCE